MKIDRNDHYIALSEKGYREDVKRKLRNLIKSEGWQILKFSLEDQYESLERNLKDIEQVLTVEELQKIRIKLYYIREIMDMPESFIKELSKDEGEQVIQDDVY